MAIWNQLPLEVQLIVLGVLGAVVGGQVNRGIYRLAWTPRIVSPWSHRDGSIWRFVPIVGWFAQRSDVGELGKRFWVRPVLIEIGFTMVYPLLYYGMMAGLLLPEGTLKFAHTESLQAQFLVQAVLWP